MAIDPDQAINKPTVLLTGASSQIGLFVIPRLVQAGFQVLAISRKGKPETYPSFDSVEWLRGSGSVTSSRKYQFLLSAGPMEVAQDFLSTGERLKAAVIFSSSSVESKRDSDHPVERSQMQAMLALESEIRQVAETSDIKLVILRPTLVYGCGLDANISRLAKWILRFGFMPVNGKAAGLRQPVHADDLASVAISAMLSDKTLPAVMTLTGGETLSYSDMVARVFTALGKPVRLLRLPESLFVFLIKLANRLKKDGGINAEMVRRQQLDLVFEDQQAHELLDFDPRSFNPDAGDFSLPDVEQVIKETDDA
jgi:nucleoside-diphosphate-sugar epimerase